MSHSAASSSLTCCFILLNLANSQFCASGLWQLYTYSVSGLVRREVLQLALFSFKFCCALRVTCLPLGSSWAECI